MLSYRVAVIQWGEHDEISQGIVSELRKLGHQATPFMFDAKLPDNADLVFSFAPYNVLQHVFRQFAMTGPAHSRPFYLHWNTENIPDPRIPWPILRLVSVFRAWLDRLDDSKNPNARFWAGQFPFVQARRHLHRFRYVGDYFYAYQQGWLNLLIDSSELFANWYKSHGLPAVFVPWGTLETYYADLHLPRNIDVLWFGQRRTRRRGQLVDYIQYQLESRGFKMYVADGVSHPFIYGETRTRLLNQAKITLNLLAAARHDNIFPYRFHVAAGNRCVVVTEPELNHCSSYVAGTHYIVATSQQMVETIVYYLQHEDERQQIAENAYQLVTTKMTFGHSLRSIMQIVERARGDADRLVGAG